MRRPLPLAATLLGALALLAACGDDAPSGEAFCGRLIAEQSLLTGGVASPADVEATVERFRELGEVAPAAVREPWEALTALVAQAAVLDPSQPDQATKLRELAYASQRAADDVSEWARATCGIELRPATTVTPIGPTAPASATQPATPSSP